MSSSKLTMKTMTINKALSNCLKTLSHHPLLKINSNKNVNYLM